MKKRLLIVLIVIMAILIPCIFVACDKNDSVNTQEDPIIPGEYESATYTVTYDANGGTTNAEWKTKTYTYGDAIVKPTYTPIKSGYIFLYWSTSKSGTPFDFINSSIESDTTLYAVYQAATTQHFYDLTAVLNKDGEGNYSIQTGAYTYGQMPSGNTIISTQYGNSSSPIAVPTTSNTAKVNGLSDYFLFWYYIKDEQPVRFTTIAPSADAPSVTPLTAYSSSESLTLYPMWLSTLPRIIVTFKDTKSELVYGTIYGYYNDVMDKELNPIQSKTGYDFNKWTYTKSEEEKVFYFNDIGDNTIDATVISNMVDYNYFDEESITVYANWTKKISISALSSYESIYQLLRKENPTDDEKLQIEELLSANIEFTSIDFNGGEFEPLFDKDHVFAGVIVGNNSGEKASLINALFKGTDNVSMFGYVSGEIRNISIVNAQYVLNAEPVDKIVVGGIASYLTSSDGFIFDCEVTASISFSGIKEITFGGVVGENAGTVQKCNVTISSCSLTANDVLVGGIIGKNKSSSKALENISNVTINSITSSNTLKIGGIAATNSGSISTSKATINVLTINANKSIGFGGITSENTAVIDQCIANVTLGTNVEKLVVGGSEITTATIGAIVGKNGGQLKNSYSTSDINVFDGSDGDLIYIGGLVGNNTSTSTSSTAGAIVNSYSKGSIKLTIDDLKNSITYVGGVAGRNTQNGVFSIFTEINIEIVNVNGTNKVGFIMGDNTATSAITIAYVSDDATISKNGETCTLDNNDKINVLLNETEQPHGNLCMASVITGTASSCMKWDDKIWEIVEEQVSLPTLIWEA